MFLADWSYSLLHELYPRDYIDLSIVEVEEVEMVYWSGGYLHSAVYINISALTNRRVYRWRDS